MSTSFFKGMSNKSTLYQTSSQNEKTNFIDVGEDSQFTAVTTAIIDNILQPNLSRENQRIAKYFLELHASYFSKSTIPGRLMTPLEQLVQLVEAPVNRAKFIKELAYALRQATVDELCRFPFKYRDAFVRGDGQIDPPTMRKPNTWIGNTAIAALSNIMNVPINVQVVEPNKVFHMRMSYNEGLSEAKGSPITLQQQNRCYLPRVSNPGSFALRAAHSIEGVKPIKQPEEDPKLSDILLQIKEESKSLLMLFNQNVECLKFKYKIDKDLTPADLMDMYIKSLNKNQNSVISQQQVGIEHGTQDFFDKTFAIANKGVKAIALPQGSLEELSINELIDSVARALSMGLLEFSVLEDQPSCKVS